MEGRMKFSLKENETNGKGKKKGEINENKDGFNGVSP